MIHRPARFSAWPIVRSRLTPLMLVLGFANLVALALHQHELSVALSVLQFVVPVVAGYEARRYGGTYGNALRTAWLTAVVSTFIVGIPLTAVGFLTGALPVQVPPGMQIDATAIVVVVLLLALLLLIVAVVIWIAWIPFTLIGAWIAREPAALPTELYSPDAAGSPPAIVQFLDWMAVFIVAFGGTLYVLFKIALDPNAVLFPGGNGPPPTSEVVFLLGLVVIGFLFWPCAAYLVIRFVIRVVQRARTRPTGW